MNDKVKLLEERLCQLPGMYYVSLGQGPEEDAPVTIKFAGASLRDVLMVTTLTISNPYWIEDADDMPDDYWTKPRKPPMRLIVTLPKPEDTFAVDWHGPYPKMGDVLEFDGLAAVPGTYSLTYAECGVRFLVTEVSPIYEREVRLLDGRWVSVKEALRLRAEKHPSVPAPSAYLDERQVVSKEFARVTAVRYLGFEPNMVRRRSEPDQTELPGLPRSSSEGD